VSLARIERFAVRQKLTMMVNRYAVHALGPDDELGPLLAVAQQKRLAFKEQVTFFTDDSRSTPVFSFKARQAIDLGATYDVMDAAGQPVGLFKKDFASSLLRSTWNLEAAGVSARGQERNALVAVVRRVVNLPFAYHFDFHDPAGNLVLSVERQFSLRDRYTVTVPGGQLDGRVAAAMAVGLDALQGR
jgi:catechol 2,3-dioxygenase-like lactoylglutathione lyase family enzyme